MTLQIRVIGPQDEVDQALSRIGTVVDLDVLRMTRTTQGPVGRVLTSLESKVHDLIGVPAVDQAVADGPAVDEVVHVSAEPRRR